jgi:hypothetical protein
MDWFWNVPRLFFFSGWLAADWAIERWRSRESQDEDAWNALASEPRSRRLVPSPVRVTSSAEDASRLSGRRDAR